MRWRFFKAEVLACLALQPERADAEHVSTTVAPLPLEKAGTDAQLPRIVTSTIGSSGAATNALRLKASAVHQAQQQQAQQLTILYGADADSSSIVLDITGFIAGEAAIRGLPTKPAVALDTAAVAYSSATCIIVCASGGPSGEPPRNATAFFNALLDPEAGRRFKGMRFALLGVSSLPSLDLEEAVGAPHQLRQRLLACGAVELVPAGECSGPDGIEQVLEPWVASLWQPLKTVLQRGGSGADSIKMVLASLYARLGGADAAAAILEALLRRAQADWRVKRFIEGAQVASTRAQIGQWLDAVLGGPLPYRGPEPSVLYARLAAEKGLNGTHLDTLVQHMAGAMAELGMPTDTINDAMAAMAMQRQLWT